MNTINRELPQVNNEAIGYLEGLLIVKNDNGSFYYIECDEDMAEQLIGDCIAIDNLDSITNLDTDLQNKILKEFGGVEYGL